MYGLIQNTNKVGLGSNALKHQIISPVYDTIQMRA